ncbi:MAG TPA: helix-turn-helix domain-containing protein [Candidatus Nanoarchaeia archaeon]|nr:helix-turn-helix domain-containing protein [Candidatus Nanoarchaeia archaeon]
MIVREESLKKLRSAFTLNIYEVKIWTALLSKGVATAGELSDMSNVPRSRSYDVLESLEKKGFIIMKLGRPIKYLAVEPAEILKRVKKAIREKSEEEVQAIDKVQHTDVFGELSLLYKQGIEHVDAANIAGSFRTRSSTYDHMLSLMANAKGEVLIATTAEGLLRKVEHMKSMLRKLHGNNVEVRVAAPLKSEKAKDAGKEIAEIAKVKDVDLEARFVIVDGKDIVFMVNHDKDVHETADAGIWVNSPFFSSAMRTLFMSAWNKK